MDKFSFISNSTPGYIESLYEDFKQNPESVEGGWKSFFEGFDFAVTAKGENGTTALNPKEFKVYNLINAYREKGHLIAKTNPIRPRKDRHANLELKYFGLEEKDLNEFFVAGESLGLGRTSLKNIVDHLQQIYCRSIGVEYTYIISPEIYEWFQKKFESGVKKFDFSIEKKERILKKLNDAVVLEKFLNTKYVGQKRFSLEGGETTIPALDAIIDLAGNDGVEEIVIGMAHRGRLNILANTLGKTYEQIFSEFEGTVLPDTTMGDGDVKYHLGYSSQIKTSSGKTVTLKLSPNPSHLEAVDPVVEGFVRAKADLLYEGNFNRVMPILIHGDASLAGQGVVYEVLQMSQLEGFHTGGTIHFVINNQIGFTTDFDDARSSNYCTSLAAMVEAPVLHVNGDDPEAVVYAAELATEFRQKFNRDVFVDMVCYRRHGHNEGDDPKFTQPNLYKLINDHPNSREIYSQQLIDAGEIEAELSKNMDKEYWKQLQDRLDAVKQKPLPYIYQEPELAWKQLRRDTPADFDGSPDTAVSAELINNVIEKTSTYPEDFTPLKKVDTLLQHRKKIFLEEGKIDWAGAELLAYSSLLLEGHDIRFSGQDVKRGTFSHRHAVLYDEKTNEEYNRLSRLAEKQGNFLIYNSLLSEFAVLGFEFGYSLSSPQTLTIWEAQFGDFTNNAQTIIDQFIVSSESKWQRKSGIVLLLPHAYEGQGPEHSSAKLERFLQSCAEYNIIVANITNPANFFHLIRRQLHHPFRLPLIVMSPKSLLRHPRCVSAVGEFTKGGFKEIYDDVKVTDASKIKRVLVCTGKVYYDLLEKKITENRNDVALVRVEQLYPLPAKQLDAVLKRYSRANFVWVQEEPANMGAWWFMQMNYPKAKWGMIARKASASPATGFLKVHQEEQTELVNKAFE